MKDKNNYDGLAIIIYKNEPDIQGVVFANTIKRNPKQWTLDSGCTLYFTHVPYKKNSLLNLLISMGNKFNWAMT